MLLFVCWSEKPGRECLSLDIRVEQILLALFLQDSLLHGLIAGKYDSVLLQLRISAQRRWITSSITCNGCHVNLRRQLRSRSRYSRLIRGTGFLGCALTAAIGGCIQVPDGS